MIKIKFVRLLCVPSLFPDEVHHEDVVPEVVGLGTGQPCEPEAKEVAHFLLGPDFDHLPGIVLRVALAETKLALHILVTTLERQNGRLENLQSIMLLPVFIHGVIDVGLLACADASIDFVKDILINHL